MRIVSGARMRDDVLTKMPIRLRFPMVNVVSGPSIKTDAEAQFQVNIYICFTNIKQLYKPGIPNFFTTPGFLHRSLNIFLYNRIQHIHNTRGKGPKVGLGS